MSEKPHGLSRRDWLKTVGVAGAAAAMPASAESQQGSPAPARETAQSLSPAEMETLEAVCARIIPSDANGPGAKEARAARYIDRGLGGFLAPQKAAYTAGLAALERYSRSSRGGPFATLSTRDQDSLLIDVETGAATGFTGGSGAFFAMVRTHTLQGTFGDPFYGGNANFVGWDLLGYPGVRVNVAAEEQRLGVKIPPNHKSAYDNEMFTKAVASLDPGTRSPKPGAGHDH